MKVADKIGFFLALTSLATNGLAQSKPDEPSPLYITGHVVTSAGEPLRDVNVHLTGLGFDETPQQNATTDSQGAFTFSLASVGKYRISPGSGFKGISKIVEVGTPADADSGNFHFERCPAPVDDAPQTSKAEPDLIGNLTLNQIVVDAPQPTVRDPKTLTPPQPSLESLKADLEAEDPQCWFGLASLTDRSAWEHLSNVNFGSWVSIEDFVGGRVNVIHVSHVTADSHLTPEQIKEQVRKVWLGSFRSISTSIMWSEGNPWNIEATVEFDDGKPTSISMDTSGHVQVQDRQGKYWFLRLWPAA